MRLLIIFTALFLLLGNAGGARAASQIHERNFCANVSEVTGKLQRAFEEKQAALENSRSQKLNQLTSNITETETKLQKSRIERDKMSLAKIDDLFKNTVSQKQKNAVEAYKKNLETALTKNRAEIDAEIQKLRAQISQTINQYNSEVDGNIAEFKQKVKFAEQNAKADCRDKNRQNSSKKTFDQSLSEAKKRMLTKKDNYPKISEQIKTLFAEYRKKIRKITENFNKEMGDAKNQLKQAYK